MSAARPDVDDSLFTGYADRLHKLASESKSSGHIYETAACLCDALCKKLLLAKRTRAMYEKGDKQGLLALATDDYNECIRLVDSFHKAFRRQWYSINKTYGFEIHDARLGGLKCRLESCRDRLIDYANGEISDIAELKEPLLPYKDTYVTHWSEMISANIV
jgi:hypothetical protein